MVHRSTCRRFGVGGGPGLAVDVAAVRFTGLLAVGFFAAAVNTAGRIAAGFIAVGFLAVADFPEFGCYVGDHGGHQQEQGVYCEI